MPGEDFYARILYPEQFVNYFDDDDDEWDTWDERHDPYSWDWVDRAIEKYKKKYGKN